jgi:ketosteroid isomerase-like protein
MFIACVLPENRFYVNVPEPTLRTNTATLIPPLQFLRPSRMLPTTRSLGMKKIIWIGAFLSAVTLMVLGQTTNSPNSEEESVRKVEDEFAAAYGRNDADTLERLWAADYTFVNPAGQVLTKAERLAMLRSGELKIEAYSRDDESIGIYGNTAVVTYRSTVKAQRNGTDISSQRRVITVLVKSGGRWQAVAQQSTAIKSDAKG